MNQTNSSSSYSCGCTGGAPALKRRSFMRLATAGAAIPFLAVTPVMAASGDYEAMIVSCIDPRFQKLVTAYAEKEGLTGKYSHFVFAGASVGVVAEAFKEWRVAFWDNLAASIQLHNIKKVIVINHRDCGAAKIAYGEAKVANSSVELATHSEVFKEFKIQLATKFPKLSVITGLMDQKGVLEIVA